MQGGFLHIEGPEDTQTDLASQWTVARASRPCGAGRSGPESYGLHGRDGRATKEQDA